MILTEELKAKIDQYFDHIRAEFLYDISVNQYKFTEDTTIEWVDKPFTVAQAVHYPADSKNQYFCPEDGNDHYIFFAT